MMIRSIERTVKKKTTDKLQTSNDEEKQKKKEFSKEETGSKDMQKKPSTSRTPRPGLNKPDNQTPPKAVSRMTLNSLPSSSKLRSSKLISSIDVRPKTKNDNTLPTKSVRHLNQDVSKESRSGTIKKEEKKTDPNMTKLKTPRTAKDLPFVSVTVNSPISTRKLPNNKPSKLKNNVDKSLRPSSSNTKLVGDNSMNRERGKTITLKEDEIKICSSSYAIDNNKEMKKLANKLSASDNSTLQANPQAFFVDLDGNISKNITPKMESDEDSYEDDFENYESDFDSYNSSESAQASNNSSSAQSSLNNYNIDNKVSTSDSKEYESHTDSITTSSFAAKRISSADEERMLDSGSYELREAQRSAAKGKTSKMDKIREAPIEFGNVSDGNYSKSKGASITDEGFIEMTVSGMSSVTTKVDIIPNSKRPDFIDFKRSRETNRLRIKLQKMAQRAKDLLAMITLDQISYTLLDIPPISYDVFMKMHAKGNSIQRSIQTNEDWVSEEIQTDAILEENKWTQYPLKFSEDEIYLTKGKNEVLLSNNLFEKASLFLDYTNNLDKNITSDNEISLKSNPLRIFLDQRHGCGTDMILSSKKYNEYFDRAKHIDEKKLNSFIDRAGSLLLKILDNSMKLDKDENVNIKNMKSDWPFSEYCQILLSNDSEGIFHLKGRAIERVFFSEHSASNILTVHSKSKLPEGDNKFDSFEDDLMSKCLICIWELDGKVPRKVLTVCDSLAACVYRGNVDGIVFAALDDGCLCVWDLKERPFWHQKIISKNPLTDKKQNKPLAEELTTTKADRDWNQEMVEKSREKDAEYIFRTCAFSSSAGRRGSGGKWFGTVVSLVFKEYGAFELATSGEGDNELTQGILGQLYLLQEYGHITIWSVFRTQDTTGGVSLESDTTAYWSTIRLNKSYEINLQKYIDVPTQDIHETPKSFNLSTAKRRNNLKRHSDNRIDGKNKTAILESSSSVARGKKYGESGRISPCNWECGVLCTDLKILMEKGNADVFLVSRNCGEVIGCRKKDGDFHIERYKVTDESHTITSLEISPSNKSYFIAGTDGGTICLFAMEQSRTLLTLNCNCTNTISKELNSRTEKINKLDLKRVWWLENDECCFLTLGSDGVLRLWDLVKSDIHPLYTVGGRDGLLMDANLAMDFGNNCLRLAALTSSGSVEIHKLLSAGPKVQRHDLFTKYVALL